MKLAEEKEEDILYKIGEEDITTGKQFQTGRIRLEEERQPQLESKSLPSHRISEKLT